MFVLFVVSKKKLQIKEISPEELGMAKYVRFYTPKKTAKIQGEQIEYFVGLFLFYLYRKQFCKLIKQGCFTFR